MNKVFLVGRVGAIPEFRQGENSVSSMTIFSVATSERYKDKSGQQAERTEWHRIVAWGRLAENVSRYVDKGAQVFIEGQIETRSWDDNGTKKYSTQIKALNIQFLGERASKSDDSLNQDSSGDYLPF